MVSVEEKIKQKLEKKGIEFEETVHEPVYTARDAARVRGLESERDGIKALVFKTDRGDFILVLSPGDKRVDTKKIARLEGVKKISLAKPEEVEMVTGVPVGCVPPFGHKTRLKTYLDEELLENEHLYFNPGSHTKTLKIRARDLLELLEDPVLYR